VARGALFFEVSETVLEARLLERGQTSGRTDDNKESIMKRFKTFESQSRPVVKYLSGITKVHEVSGEQPPDEVFKAVCAALGHPPPA
jgi:adenylate kinase family enzyme